jgi:hypothetical protein
MTPGLGGKVGGVEARFRYYHTRLPLEFVWVNTPRVAQFSIHSRLAELVGGFERTSTLTLGHISHHDSCVVTVPLALHAVGPQCWLALGW